MSGNMLDLSGWRRITCAESDELRQNKTPISSLTDLSGQYGEPTIYTEWAGVDGKPVLREYLWPRTPGRDCEHWVPAEIGGTR